MSQKGSKKHGRNKRKPSNMAYAAEGRLAKNKKARAARHTKRMEKQAAKVAARKAKLAEVSA